MVWSLLGSSAERSRVHTRRQRHVVPSGLDLIFADEIEEHVGRYWSRLEYFGEKVYFFMFGPGNVAGLHVVTIEATVLGRATRSMSRKPSKMQPYRSGQSQGRRARLRDTKEKRRTKANEMVGITRVVMKLASRKQPAARSGSGRHVIAPAGKKGWS